MRKRKTEKLFRQRGDRNPRVLVEKLDQGADFLRIFSHFSEFLEKRESVDYMRRRIEDLEDRCRSIEKKHEGAPEVPGKPGNPSP